MKIIDISLPLQPDMPTWPGSRGLKVSRTLSLEKGDPANVTQVDMDVHTGTHIEAPAHFLKNGYCLNKIPVNVLVGAAYVAHLPDVDFVTARDLAALSIPKGIERLLLRTRNSKLWTKGVKKFVTNYTALTKEAAEWVADHNIKLIGIDYLSIQRYQDSSITHQVLMRAGVVIVEGLNLSRVKPGKYELICLPIKLIGTEAAPARALLRPIP